MTCQRCGKENPAEAHTCTPVVKSYREAYLLGFADGAESLTLWHFCKDKMPYQDGRYIVANKMSWRHVEICSLRQGKWDTDTVYAWKPLPNPPEEK